MQNVFVMSHASDIDGVGSAALIKKKFNLPLSRLFFSDYSKESIGYVDSKLEDHYKEGITLYIADLGVNDSIVDSYLSILKKVKKYGGKIYWYDHHPWTELAIKKLTPLCESAIIGENKKYCATEITFKELGFNDDFTKKFVNIVHHSDFNKKPKSNSEYRTIGFYALSITYYNTNDSKDYLTDKLRHIADVVSRGKLVDKSIKADAEHFNKINEERVQKMIKDLEIRDDVAIGFSKHIQSTYGCMAVIDAGKKKIGIYVNIDAGRGHIRSTGPSITELARSMGGGGHPRASGFNVDLKKFSGLKSKSDRAKFADDIQEKIRKYVILK